MAKLNGVTTVSDRIQYNGAEYVKSDEAAVYEVTRIDSLDDPQVIDDDGDEFDLCGEDKTVFKRAEVAVPAPTPPPALPDQYVIHDGKVYVKEARARKATAGDKLIITNTFPYKDAYKDGDILTYRCDCFDDMVYVEGVKYGVLSSEYNVLVPTDSVTVGGVEYTLEKRGAKRGETILCVVSAGDSRYHTGDIGKTTDDCSGLPDVTWSNGKNNAISLSRFIVLVPKATAQPQYREANRKANVGDRIRIVKTAVSNRGFSVGDEFTVNRVDTDGSDDVRVTLNGDDRKLVVRSEYVVLEPTEAAAKKTEEPRLKVGEYAKVIGGPNTQTKIEDIVQIAIVNDSYYSIADLDGNRIGAKMLNNVVRATDAEVAEAKRKNVKVGDYVRITENQSNWSVGTIVKVTQTDAVGNGKTLRATDGEDTYLADYICVEPVTPAEAEQAREAAAKAAETAKWAKIGRKVDEIKRGDLVRVVNGCFGEKNGTIGTAKHDGSAYSMSIIGGIDESFYGIVELIAPVESLFSR